MVRMIHPDGGAHVFQHAKSEIRGDRFGVFDIPLDLVTTAAAQGFIDAADYVSGAVSPAELAMEAASLDAPVAPPPTQPMRAPLGIQSATYHGEEFVIPRDRVCAVPIGDVEQFGAFGFVCTEE